MNKTELISGLQQEYRGWLTLLDQIGPEHMDQPDAAGNWSIKDITAHLAGWRRRTVARLQAAGRGEPEPPPPWPAHLQTDAEINEWIYNASHDKTVQEVLEDSNQVFENLLTAIESLPDQVFMDAHHYLPWWEGNSLTSEAFFSHFHEEHEPDMRAFLAQVKREEHMSPDDLGEL